MLWAGSRCCAIQINWIKFFSFLWPFTPTIAHVLMALSSQAQSNSIMVTESCGETTTFSGRCEISQINFSHLIYCPAPIISVLNQHTESACRGLRSTQEVRTKRETSPWRRAWAQTNWRWTWTRPATCRVNWVLATSLLKLRSWWRAWETTVSVQTSR